MKIMIPSPHKATAIFATALLFGSIFAGCAKTESTEKLSGSSNPLQMEQSVTSSDISSDHSAKEDNI